MNWKKVGTAFVENEGESLFIDGFEAERIRVTALVASVNDDKGLRFSVGRELYTHYCNVGQSTSAILLPLMFELTAVGNYAISTPFVCPNKIIKTNTTTSMIALGMELESDEQLLKRIRLESANDKLAVGSWMKVEVIE